uniref:Sulfotransferase n=1 Tax=Amazona collaria TaxID=241587 RepID=A0A8B9F8M8_9PSIT
MRRGARTGSCWLDGAAAAPGVEIGSRADTPICLQEGTGRSSTQHRTGSGRCPAPAPEPARGGEGRNSLGFPQFSWFSPFSRPGTSKHSGAPPPPPGHSTPGASLSSQPRWPDPELRSYDNGAAWRCGRVKHSGRRSPRCLPWDARPKIPLLGCRPVAKTQLPVQLLLASIQDKDCKVMPRDVISSSYFYQMSKMLLTLAHWEITYGSWYKHVWGWWEKKQKKQLLSLFCEDMKKMRVQKILWFLGKEVVQRMVARILQHMSFGDTRKNPAANYEAMPTALMDHSLSPFLWKPLLGGGWRNAVPSHLEQGFALEPQIP